MNTYIQYKHTHIYMCGCRYVNLFIYSFIHYCCCCFHHYYHHSPYSTLEGRSYPRSSILPRAYSLLYWLACTCNVSSFSLPHFVLECGWDETTTALSAHDPALSPDFLKERPFLSASDPSVWRGNGSTTSSLSWTSWAVALLAVSPIQRTGSLRTAGLYILLLPSHPW